MRFLLDVGHVLEYLRAKFGASNAVNLSVQALPVCQGVVEV